MAAGNFELAEMEFRRGLVLAQAFRDTETLVPLGLVSGLINALEEQGKRLETDRVLVDYDWIVVNNTRRLQAVYSDSYSREEAQGALRPFTITEGSAAIRRAGKVSGSVEELASFTCRWLFENLLTDSRSVRSSSLVRCFVTMPYENLERSLQKRADALASGVTKQSRCLTLMGTAGSKPEWNDRRKSVSHSVIPLLSPEMVAQSPMISRLFTELGINVSCLFLAERDHKPMFLDPSEKDYNVFYVPEASASPHIIAQSEFVKPNKIRSVIGYGSLLPSGELYAVIVFFRIFVPRDVAQKFTSLALSTTIGMLTLGSKPTFAETPFLNT